MRFYNFALIAAFARVSLAQVDLNGLLQAFNASGLTTLAGLVMNLNQTTVGQELVTALTGSGHYAIFAPSDQAFSQVASNFTSDPDLVANTLAYHLYNGNFSTDDSSGASLQAQSYPNVTIGRSFLNNSQYVNLEGGKAQVLVWTRNGSDIQVLNQPGNVTVTNSTRIEGTGIRVNVISSVLSIPPSLSAVLTDPNFNQNSSLSTLSTFLNNTQIPVNGQNQSLATILEAQHGFTLFAPNDQAIQATESSFGFLGSNTTALEILLMNHIINGTSVYSSELASGGTFTSASGEPLQVVTNSSGTFVTNGNTTAMVTHSDILTNNSVVHAIDHAFINLDTDPSAASSAYESATSTAASQTTETGAVGAPTSTSSDSSASAGVLSNGALALTSVKAMVTSLSGVIGFILVGVCFA